MKRISFRCVVCRTHQHGIPAYEDFDGPVCEECEASHEEAMSEFVPGNEDDYPFIWGDDDE